MATVENPSLLDSEDRLLTQPQEPTESPTYNGLSPEAFLAGSEILQAWEKLPVGTRVELAPHLLRHMVYQLYGDQLSVSQVDEIAEALEQGLSGMNSVKGRIEDSLRPRDLLPYDY
ncbi:MAG TPA: hypothetical protein VFP35_03845 [Candidatus Saccharimonadales bacterium]|nr:hypothetical protein [Candidatus Saccharimonadales bacterium]